MACEGLVRGVSPSGSCAGFGGLNAPPPGFGEPRFCCLCLDSLKFLRGLHLRIPLSAVTPCALLPL